MINIHGNILGLIESVEKNTVTEFKGINKSTKNKVSPKKL